MFTRDPCLIHARLRADEVPSLGHPLLDRYVEFVVSRARPNTVRATVSADGTAPWSSPTPQGLLDCSIAIRDRRRDAIHLAVTVDGARFASDAGQFGEGTGDRCSGDTRNCCSRMYYSGHVADLFDLEALDDDDPFEIDRQAAHLFKHPYLGIDDILDVWRSDPLFFAAKPPAHWLMVGEIAGRVLVVPLAPSDSRNSSHCRPIGCYLAAPLLAERFRKDR